MLIDETKYLWSKGKPEDVLLSEDPFFYVPEQALRIYRFEGTGEFSIYSDTEMIDLLFRGTLPYEPDVPIACDGLTFVAETELVLHFISEVGILKTVLTPFLNTSENMTAISSSYNDDGTFSTEGLSGFMFNGIAASPMYISSNHWLGFGTNSEQLKILRRDGCSTSIYRQLGETSNGLQFLKIRFEGYTVYSNRVESNRLIFELFLLSNNDMFLNVIQTPTSGNTGTSELICNGMTTALTLFDGSGGGTQVSVYHQDSDGRSWKIIYAMYEQKGSESYGYLLKQGDSYYTITDGELTACDIKHLTAAMFLKYGFEELPSAELLTPLVNPEFYFWKAGGSEELLKATLKAYPYPQVLDAVADMSHISIIGIKLLTAEYSGDVGICVSLDGGATYSEEMTLGDWLNTDVEELWNSLPESRRVYFHFILHDNAALSRFKITYIN